MKHIVANLVSGLALVLLAAPVQAQSVGEKTGVNSTLGISPTTADFVKEAATSDMFEIQSSELAQARGNPAEKVFAADMLGAHKTTTKELKEIDKLKSLNGADFNSRYNSDQVSGHKDAVSLFERYAKDGDNPKLKDWAGKTLPTIRHHLEMAQDLAAGKTVGSH